MKNKKREKKIVDFDNKEHLPCVILSVDSAKQYGACIIRSHPKTGFQVISVRGGNVYGNGIEKIITEAIEYANAEQLMLVMVLESWGSGGRLGLKQWVSLGEARGPWKRQYIQFCELFKSSIINPKKIVAIDQTTWRSTIILETGKYVDGKFTRFTTDEWKERSMETCNRLFPGLGIEDDNIADAVCMGFYASKSDEVKKLLTKTYLKKVS